MDSITIIGYGKMAKALCGALNGNFALEIAGRNERKIKQFIKDNNLRNADAILIKDTFDIRDKIVILAIKPYALESFAYKNTAACVYSIMAGISCERLRQVLRAKSYCRVMPNIASLVGAGVNIIYTADDSIKPLTERIFAPSGKNIYVDKESLINPAGAISGSGTAYLGLVAEALIDAGVREGLSAELSKEIVNGLFKGFGELLQSSEAHDIRLDTTSPGGTTAEAIMTLEKRSIRGAFIEAVHNAAAKANNIK